MSGKSCSSTSPSTSIATPLKGWNLVKQLGSGMFGKVYLVSSKSDPKELMAVKEMTHDGESNQEVVELVEVEGQIHEWASEARHSNIIELYKIKKDSKSFFMCMEYADGGSLRDIIEKDVGLPPYQAQHYFRQLADGLEFLHSLSFVHRDIKLENLLLTSSGTLKIADFGFAQIFRDDEGKERFLEMECGTRRYMAPEVGKKKYRAEPVDVWSSGVTLIVMLTGNWPWSQANESSVRYQHWKKNLTSCEEPWTKIDPMILDLLRKMLHKKARKRPTMAEVADHPWIYHKYNKSMKRRRIIEESDDEEEEKLHKRPKEN